MDTILQQLHECDVDRNKVIGCRAVPSFQYQQISFCHGKVEGHICFTPITTRTASTTTWYKTEKHIRSIRRGFWIQLYAEVKGGAYRILNKQIPNQF